MSTEQRRGRGRPPREAGGPGVYHLGLRFNAHRRDQILRAVEAANERARAAGVPSNITASGLVAMWIGERLDEEMAKLDEQESAKRRRK